MSDLVEVLRDYQRWMKDAGGLPSIDVDDIDGDDTFGAAADRIAELEAEVENLKVNLADLELSTVSVEVFKDERIRAETAEAALQKVTAERDELSAFIVAVYGDWPQRKLQEIDAVRNVQAVVDAAVEETAAENNIPPGPAVHIEPGGKDKIERLRHARSDRRAAVTALTDGEDG